jgi:hypothetical protein
MNSKKHIDFMILKKKIVISKDVKFDELFIPSLKSVVLDLLPFAILIVDL